MLAVNKMVDINNVNLSSFVRCWFSFLLRVMIILFNTFDLDIPLIESTKTH